VKSKVILLPMSNLTPLKDLAASLEGTLLYDDLHKTLYATDASAYRIMPAAVAIPKSDEDIVKIIRKKIRFLSHLELQELLVKQ
jgi:hypothetical protein